MKTLTMNDVLTRLVEIASASNGGARGADVLSCDILHQDALYKLQSDLAHLLADVANACGPIQVRVLEQRFPNVFVRS